MPYEAARDMEVELAIGLREAGHEVAVPGVEAPQSSFPDTVAPVRLHHLTALGEPLPPVRLDEAPTLVAEHLRGELRELTRELVTAAQQLSRPVTVAVMPSGRARRCST